MDWTIKIEGKSNQRIMVNFDPENESITFIGQYKPHNREWVNFSQEKHSMIIDLETIQELLENVYDIMKKRLEAYEELNQGFSILKVIEIEL